VRALRRRRKDYTTEGIVLGAYRWWSPRNPLSILVGSSGFQWVQGAWQPPWTITTTPHGCGGCTSP